MARQTFTINPASLLSIQADPLQENLSIRWRSVDSAISTDTINSDLLETNETAYLARIDLQAEGDQIGEFPLFHNRAYYRIYTSIEPTRVDEFDTFSGPQLSDAWERSPVAVTISAGNLSLVIPGPNSLEWESSDDVEPYSWVAHRQLEIGEYPPIITPSSIVGENEPANAKQLIDEVVAFMSAWDALPQSDKDATTITLDDNINPTLVPNTPLSVPENSPVGTTLGVAATAENFSDGSPNWRFGNGTTTSFLFDINPNTGVLFLNVVPDYDSLSQNNRENGFTRTVVLEQGGDTASTNVQIFVIPEPVRLSSTFSDTITGSTTLNVIEPNPVRISFSFNGVIGGSSTLNIIEPNPVRISFSFNNTISGSSTLNVIEPNPVRISSTFNGVIGGSSTLNVQEPNSTRISSSFNSIVGGSSTLNVIEPNPVRISSSFNSIVGGSSTLNIIDPVRISSSFNSIIGGSSTLNVIEPNPVRISSIFDGAIGGSSSLNVIEPTSVRLSSTFNGVIGGSTNLNVIEPAAVRLSITFAGAVGGTANLNVIEPNSIRLSTVFNDSILGSATLDVIEPNPIRLDTSFNGIVGGSSSLTLIEPDSVRISSSFTGIIGGISTVEVSQPERLAQTLTIGNANFVSLVDPEDFLRLEWRNTPTSPISSNQINPNLVVNNQEAYIALFLIRTVGIRDTSNNITEYEVRYGFNTSTTPTESGFFEGPQLIDEWKQSLVAIRISAGDLTLTIPGPRATNWVLSDDAEPYSWTARTENDFLPATGPDNADELLTQAREFIIAWGALPQEVRDATTITLDSGIVPELLPNTLSVPENSPIGTEIGIAATPRNFISGTPNWRFGNGTTTSFLFDIDPSTGVISLNASPDFENISQNNMENGFTRTIVLEQGIDTATVNIQIFISDIFELTITDTQRVVATISQPQIDLIDGTAVFIPPQQVQVDISRPQLTQVRPGDIQLSVDQGLNVSITISVPAFISNLPGQVNFSADDINVQATISEPNLNVQPAGQTLLTVTQPLTAVATVSFGAINQVIPTGQGLQVTESLNAAAAISEPLIRVDVNFEFVTQTVIASLSRPAISTSDAPTTNLLVTDSLQVRAIINQPAFITQLPDETFVIPTNVHAIVSLGRPGLTIGDVSGTQFSATDFAVSASISQPALQTLLLGVVDANPLQVYTDFGNAGIRLIVFSEPQQSDYREPPQEPRTDDLLPADYRYDLSKLFTQDMLTKEQWRDLAEAVSRVFFQYIYSDIQGLANIKDPNFLQVRSSSEPTYHIRQDQGRELPIIDLRQGQSNNYDRQLLHTTARNFGFHYFTDSISNQDYFRLIESYNQFIVEKSPLNFLDYIGYIKNVLITSNILWTNDYNTFVTEDQVPTGQKITDTPKGDFYPTPHVEILVDLTHPNSDINEITQLFNHLSPTHIVLERIGSSTSAIVIGLQINSNTKEITTGQYRAIPRISII